MRINNIYSSHEEVPQRLNKMSDSLGRFMVKLNVVNLLMGILQCCGVMFQQRESCCSLISFSQVSLFPVYYKTKLSFQRGRKEFPYICLFINKP